MEGSSLEDDRQDPTETNDHVRDEEAIHLYPGDESEGGQKIVELSDAEVDERIRAVSREINSTKTYLRHILDWADLHVGHIVQHRPKESYNTEELRKCALNLFADSQVMVTRIRRVQNKANQLMDAAQEKTRPELNRNDSGDLSYHEEPVKKKTPANAVNFHLKKLETSITTLQQMADDQRARLSDLDTATESLFTRNNEVVRRYLAVKEYLETMDDEEEALMREHRALQESNIELSIHLQTKQDQVDEALELKNALAFRLKQIKAMTWDPRLPREKPQGYHAWMDQHINSLSGIQQLPPTDQLRRKLSHRSPRKSSTRKSWNEKSSTSVTRVGYQLKDSDSLSPRVPSAPPKDAPELTSADSQLVSSETEKTPTARVLPRGTVGWARGRAGAPSRVFTFTTTNHNENKMSKNIKFNGVAPSTKPRVFRPPRRSLPKQTLLHDRPVFVENF